MINTPLPTSATRKVLFASPICSTTTNSTRSSNVAADDDHHDIIGHEASPSPLASLSATCVTPVSQGKRRPSWHSPATPPSRRPTFHTPSPIPSLPPKPSPTRETRKNVEVGEQQPWTWRHETSPRNQSGISPPATDVVEFCVRATPLEVSSPPIIWRERRFSPAPLPRRIPTGGSIPAATAVLLSRSQSVRSDMAQEQRMRNQKYCIIQRLLISHEETLRQWIQLDQLMAQHAIQKGVLQSRLLLLHTEEERLALQRATTAALMPQEAELQHPLRAVALRGVTVVMPEGTPRWFLPNEQSSTPCIAKGSATAAIASATARSMETSSNSTSLRERSCFPEKEKHGYHGRPAVPNTSPYEAPPLISSTAIQQSCLVPKESLTSVSEETQVTPTGGWSETTVSAIALTNSDKTSVFTMAGENPARLPITPAAGQVQPSYRHPHDHHSVPVKKRAGPSNPKLALATATSTPISSPLSRWRKGNTEKKGGGFRLLSHHLSSTSPTALASRTTTTADDKTTQRSPVLSPATPHTAAATTTATITLATPAAVETPERLPAEQLPSPVTTTSSQWSHSITAQQQSPLSYSAAPTTAVSSKPLSSHHQCLLESSSHQHLVRNLPPPLGRPIAFASLSPPHSAQHASSPRQGSCNNALWLATNSSIDTVQQTQEQPLLSQHPGFSQRPKPALYDILASINTLTHHVNTLDERMTHLETTSTKRAILQAISLLKRRVADLDLRATELEMQAAN